MFKKKLTAGVMALSLCFSLGACGSVSGNTTGSTSGSTGEATEAAGPVEGADADYAKVREKGKLVVGITDFEPMDYKDEAGNWIPLQPSAKPGDLRFIDQNGDGLLDNNDKVKMGSGNPKANVGLNLSLQYKQFDLIANFYGSFGAKRYDYTKMQLQRMDKNFNYGKDALNAWTPENTNTHIPRAVQGDPNGNNRISDRYVEHGDYVRLNNLQLGYNLPSKVCKHLGISNLRVYIGGSRLFTITRYDGYDPAVGADVGLMGVDEAIYPLSRTYMAGLNFVF